MRWRPPCREMFRAPDGRELKFDPYHDPRNGQFTFGPGGAGAGASGSLRRATSRVGQKASLTAAGPGSEEGRGSNSRAFEDPMTLEQSFPGLRNSPGGAVVAVADGVFDFTGPADATATDVLQNHSRQLILQIKAIDPTWHYNEIGPTDALGNPIQTVRGLSAKVNDLRFQRAAVIARVKGDHEPLQVETLRFVQQRADGAYDEGMAALKIGRLKPRLSDQEAVGNYVDREVRLDLRRRYNQLGRRRPSPCQS